MRKSLIVGGLAAAILASSPGFAATVIYGAANPGGNVSLIAAGPGALSNSISFDVSGTGNFIATLNFDNSLSGAKAHASASFAFDPDVVTFTSASFNGLGTSVASFTPKGSSIQLNLPALTTGMKSLIIKGTLTKPARGNAFARIGGSLTLTAPAVPEPESWSLLILGFGAVGAGLRRRHTNGGVLGTAARVA